MSLRTARALALVLPLLLAPGSGLLHAEPRDPARADTLFREGREAMKQRDYDTACARFRESQSKDPAPGTLLNLADCEEKLGHLIAAYRHVERALPELPPRDDRARIARERLVALERRLALVTVRTAAGTPPGARVTLDGGEIPAAHLGVAERVDPGTHVLTLVSPDGREHRLSVLLHEGEAREVLLEVAPLPASPPASASSSARAPAPPPSAPPSPALSAPPAARPRDLGAAYVAGSIGLAGVLVAGVSAAVLLHDKSIADKACDRGARTCVSDEGVDAARAGKALEPWFYGAAIVGLAGLATSAILVFRSDESRAAIAFSGGPSGVALRGRF